MRIQPFLLTPHRLGRFTGKTYAHQRQKFHIDDVMSGGIWSGALIGRRIVVTLFQLSYTNDDEKQGKGRMETRLIYCKIVYIPGIYTAF